MTGCVSVNHVLQCGCGVRLNSQWNGHTYGDTAIWRTYDLQTMILSVQGFEPFSGDSET